VPVRLAGVKAGCVHLGRWQVTLSNQIRQVTLRSSDTGSRMHTFTTTNLAEMTYD